MTASHAPRLLAAATTLAALTLGLAACGTEDASSPATTSSSPAPTESTEPTPTPTPEPTTDEPTTDAPTGAEPEPSDLPPFGAAGTPQSAEPSGDLLLPVGLRVGGHEGYDRVVVELEGTGTPGWQVEYVEEAIEDGRGEVIDVAGDAILSVYVSGTRYPDEGEEHYVPGEPLAGAGVIEEVHYVGTFEGLTQLFVGVDSGPADYRVLTLSDPARLVIDVAAG